VSHRGEVHHAGFVNARKTNASAPELCADAAKSALFVKLDAARTLPRSAIELSTNCGQNQMKSIA
jgi:hypothetical protein